MRFAEAEEMRAGSVQHPRQRQVERLVKRQDAGEAAGRRGEAVIRAEPRDDLLLLGLAAQVVVVAHQLEIGVVGVGTGGAEKHLRQVPGAGTLAEQRQHAVGEADDRLVRVGREQMVVAEIGHRLGRRLAQFGAAIADVDAPQPGAAVDQLAALAVAHPHARGTGDDRRAVLQMVGDRGRGMEDALPVHLLKRIVLRQVE